MSLPLQAEQEKQFTHQALLRADTTVKSKWGLSRPCPGWREPSCTQ